MKDLERTAGNARMPELSLGADGSRVAIEGMLLGYVDGSPEIAVLRAEDGRDYEIALPNGRIELSGEGALTREQPEPGDHISLVVTIRRDSLEADWWDSCVLRSPAPDRSVRRAQIAEMAAARLESIRAKLVSLEYAGARREIALLRREDLSNEEHSQAIALALQMPIGERPSLVPLVELRSTRPTNDRIRKIDSAYGVCIEAMNNEELIEFAREVLLGDARPPSEECGHLDVLLALESVGVDPLEREALLKSCVAARMEAVRRSGAGGSLDERLLLNQLFRAVVSGGTEGSVAFALDVLLDCLERAEYRGAGWHSLDPIDRQMPLSDAPLCALAIYVSRIPKGPIRERLEALRSAQRLLSIATDDPMTASKLALLVDAASH